MAFMSLKIIYSKKKQVLLNFALFHFVYLLRSLINERLHNRMSVFKEDAIKHTLGAKYGSRFRQRFLGSFNWIFVCCQFVLFEAT